MTVTIHAGRLRSVGLLIAASIALAGCTGMQKKHTGVPVAGSEAATPKSAELISYFEMLDGLAPGDPARQSTEFQAIKLASEQSPTASNRLHYAIALGAAGHVDSNPIEARHLLSELLATTPTGLRPQEVLLANAYLREFDARVALYADLAREREEADRKLQSEGAENDRRYAALNAETQRLRKALADAERKLEAVAEMERTLTPQGQ